MKIKTHTAFTLIELMVVVAILGVLATVSVPAYQAYILRAKLAVAYSNIDAMNKAQTSFFYDRGFFSPMLYGSYGPDGASGYVETSGRPFALHGRMDTSIGHPNPLTVGG